MSRSTSYRVHLFSAIFGHTHLVPEHRVSTFCHTLLLLIFFFIFFTLWDPIFFLIPFSRFPCHNLNTENKICTYM